MFRSFLPTKKQTSNYAEADTWVKRVSSHPLPERDKLYCEEYHISGYTLLANVRV